MSLKIDAVIGNPPYNADRQLISYQFLYQSLKYLKPRYINFIIPVSTSDPRLGSYSEEYKYVRSQFYGSDHILRTIDFYRGYLAFQDKSGNDLGCIDGGVECIVYDSQYHGKCHTVLFADYQEKSSFNSLYYWFTETRLRHKLDILITHHLYPSVQQYLNTRRFTDFMLDQQRKFRSCPDTYYVITMSGARLHYVHELYSTKKSSPDIRVCLKSDYIEPNDSEGMDIHRRFVACVPADQVWRLVAYMSSRFFSYLTWITTTGRHVDQHNMRLIPEAPLTEPVIFDGEDIDSQLYRFFNVPVDLQNHINRVFNVIMPVPRTAKIHPYEFTAESILAGKHSDLFPVPSRSNTGLPSLSLS